jgi:hypothetical protein
MDAFGLTHPETVALRFEPCLSDSPVQEEPAIRPEFIPNDRVIDPDESRPGGCFRGIFFALAFQSAAACLVILLYKLWRLSH